MAMTDQQKEILKAFGEKVKSIRMEKNLTRQEVAYLIDKEPQSLYRLETGGVNPSLLYLLDICRGLNIDITELLSDEIKG